MSDQLLSGHYHSILDGAIFDGRVRIYYSQFDEDEALKLYFELQNARILDTGLKKYTKEEGIVFIYLYPEDLRAENIPEFEELDFLIKNIKSNRYIMTRTPIGTKLKELISLVRASLTEFKNVESNSNTKS